MINEVTLFCFWGVGDVINYTWAPRLIKERISRSIKINILIRKSQSNIFKNNKYVDKIIEVDDNFAETNKRNLKTGHFENEINMWCLLPPKTINDYHCWDIAYESARNINIFFGGEFFSKEDDLLAELYYTDEQRKNAEIFSNKYSPYIILETEFRSGQSYFEPQDIMRHFASGIKTNKFNLFTSSLHTPTIPPLTNISHIHISDVGLLIEKSEAFYGLSSGLSTISLERTLSEPKRRVLAVKRNNFIDYHMKKTPMNNTILIPNDSYICFTIKDINRL